MKDEQQYRAALDWIHGLERFGIKPGLERIQAMLEMLGNPHHRLSFIHIAGTNGKGSTAALLSSIFCSAGYRVGLYTSPYLLSFTNRMAVNGSDITPQELVDLVATVRPLVKKISNDSRYGQPTEFEVVTLIAMEYYARQEVDLVVLETGLGGRLDATNVVTPLLSIITNISLEHTGILGDTIEAIAREKAGIIKPDRPVLTASEDPTVLQVIRSCSLALNAPMHKIKSSGSLCSNTDKPVYCRNSVSPDGQTFKYQGFNWCFDDLFIPLRGKYQVVNGATAVAAAELLVEQGFNIDEAAVRQGLAKTVWPGRLELMQQKPQLVMDGAHNPEAVRQLASSIPDYFNYHRLILVIGILADKDSIAMLDSILLLSDMVIFTRPTTARAADPTVLADIAVDRMNYDRERIVVIADIGTALKKAMSLADKEDMVLVTGSLYTVSDARLYWADHMQ